MSLSAHIRLLSVAFLAAMAMSCATRPRAGSPAAAATSRPVLQSVDPANPTVRIGSWNLRWLGPSAHNRFEARTGEDLAGYIAASGVSVLAVQEAGQSPGTNLRNSTLDATIKCLNDRTAGKWDYVLFPSQVKEQSALTGIAWDTTIVRMAEPPVALPVGLNKDNPTDGAVVLACPPWAARFEVIGGSGDFVVVPVDLADNTTSGDRAAHRVAETRQLIAGLSTIRARFSSAELILIGDFAMPLSTETPAALLADAGLRDLNAQDLPTSATGMPYSRAFVPANSRRLSGNTAIGIVKYPTMGPDVFRQKLSDNYIITVELPKK